jgi:hypothetical protein
MTDTINDQITSEITAFLAMPPPHMRGEIIRHRAYVDAVRGYNAIGEHDVEIAAAERDLLWMQAVLARSTDGDA